MKPATKPTSVPRIPKKMVCIRLDTDILDWFKKGGPGYQTVIGKVLREYKNRNEFKYYKVHQPKIRN